MLFMGLGSALFLASSIVLLSIANIVLVEANSDSDALSAFRQRITSDPQNALDSWDTTLVDPCTWFHVTCDDDSRVIRVDVLNYNISGSLAPELANLDRLQYLELSNNQLTGTIPQELGKIVGLKSLNLGYNLLSGGIPASLGSLTNIIFIYLNNNKLGGSIPDELRRIPTLRFLDVSQNDICGQVPPFNSGVTYVDYSNNPRINGPC